MSEGQKSLRGRRSFLWVEGGFLLCAVALGGVLWWEWQSGMTLKSSIARWRNVPATAVPPLAIAPEFRLPDAATGFPELLARPIFQVSRRVAVDPSNRGPSAMKRGQFVLVGVLVSPATSAALLRDAETGKTEAVALGGQIRGLTLAEVKSERAVLRLGAEFEELQLALQRGPVGKRNAGGAANATVAASPPPTASKPAVEGVIPPTVPVPPTPAQPYTSTPHVGPGAGLGAGGGGAATRVGPLPGAASGAVR